MNADDGTCHLGWGVVIHSVNKYFSKWLKKNTFGRSISFVPMGLELAKYEWIIHIYVYNNSTKMYRAPQLWQVLGKEPAQSLGRSGIPLMGMVPLSTSQLWWRNKKVTGQNASTIMKRYSWNWEIRNLLFYLFLPVHFTITNFYL